MYGRKNSLTHSILGKSFRQLIYASKPGLNALSPATSARFTPIPKVVLLPSIQISGGRDGTKAAFFA